MAARTIKLDMGALIDALTANPAQMQWFLNLESGELDWRSRDGAFCEQDEDEIDFDDDRFLAVEPLTSQEKYRIMEGFAATVDEPELSEQLAVALNGRGAFSRFGEVVYPHADVSARWSKYQRDVLEQQALQWLDGHDIEPVYTLPEIVIPPATAPAKNMHFANNVGMLAMLLFGAREGKVGPSDGVAIRVYQAPNPEVARNVFGRVAREVCEFAGIPWRKRFAQKTNAFEAGPMKVEVRDRMIELRVQANAEVWKEFSR
ncbi:MAG: UPF0158 family protein [Polyangiaceae bacterium]|nr:UPF0158 family protein [Polyangiaceae bacterium]